MHIKSTFQNHRVFYLLNNLINKIIKIFTRDTEDIIEEFDIEKILKIIDIK